MTRHITDILAAAGVIVIAVGLALVYVPAGVIAVGVALLAIAVMRSVHEPPE